MFIPSLKKFELNKVSNRYEKRVIHNEHVYKVSIHYDKWNDGTRRSINRWLRSIDDLTTNTFPFGYIIKENQTHIQDVLHNKCEFCSRNCKNIQTKRRHMKNCRHKDTPKEKPPSGIVPLENTRIQNGGNIINNNNNNNNITINNYIQICDFGKENQQWLTKDVLKCLFLDRKTAVKHLIRSKHFNEKFPENKNIRLDTKSNINRRLQVYSNGRWRIREAKPVIDSTFVNTHEIITDLLNIDDPPYDDDHQSQVIKDFQGTEKFQNKYNRLLRKWDDFGHCIQKEDTEFQEYWEYIKTLLLDQKLMIEQQEITHNRLTQ